MEATRVAGAHVLAAFFTQSPATEVLTGFLPEVLLKHYKHTARLDLKEKKKLNRKTSRAGEVMVVGG